MLRRHREEDLEREIRAHLDLEAEEQRESGLPLGQAHRAARRAFGNIALTKEDTRAQWGWSSLGRIGQDLRYANRMLWRNPGFTLVALLTLALGIGANTAIFSVVNTVLVRPLPYRDSDRIVRIVDNVPGTSTMTGLPQRRTWIPLDRLSELRTQTQTLSQLAGYQSTAMTLTSGVQAVRLAGHRVSPSIFRLLGESAYLGRTLEPGDEEPSAPAAIVLSYSAWRTHLASDPDIVGRVITLDSSPYTVVGVMPQRFEFPDRQTQFWINLKPVSGPGGVVAQAIGRLADGVSVEEAAAEANLLYERALGDGPSFFERIHGQPSGETRQDTDQSRLELVSVKEELVAPVRQALLVLIVAVGFVLLIACTNVANLLLARTASRQREMGIRTALGAGRARLTCQVLTESLLLGLLGGVAGSALAVLAIGMLKKLGPGVLPRLQELRADESVFLFTLVVSVLTGLLFGLAPALRLSRVSHAISEGTASAAAGFGLFRRHSTRGVLVVGEISIAMVLLIGAGLMIHSFVKLTSVNPGFNPSHLLTFQVALPPARHHDSQLLTGELIAGLESLPGVTAAGTTTILPLAYSGPTPMWAIHGLSVPVSPQEAPSPRIVSHDYLTAMGIRVLDGRGFRESDRGRRLVLVNHAMVERYFADENPLGKTIYFSGPRDPGWEIVGVVDDVRQSGLSADPQPEFYIDLRQQNSTMLPVPHVASGGMFFAVRTDGDPASIVPHVRDLVHRIDREATLELNVASMEERLSDSVARPRLYAMLLGTFAAVAAILAAVGVYGVVAYAVAQRTREIGIRIALGARGSEVLALVLRQGLTLVFVGVAVGLLGALAVTKYLAAMLFGLSPLDPVTFAAVSFAFTITAALACYVPARRAARVDPMVALRHD